MSQQSSDMGADEVTHAPRGSKKKKRKPYAIEFTFRGEQKPTTWKRYATYKQADKAIEGLRRKYPEEWNFHITREITFKIEKQQIINAPSRVLNTGWKFDPRGD